MNHHLKDIEIFTLDIQNWKPSASFDKKTNLLAPCPHRQMLKKEVCWGPRSIPISVFVSKHSVALEGTPEQLWRWDTKLRMLIKISPQVHEEGSNIESALHLRCFHKKRKPKEWQPTKRITKKTSKQINKTPTTPVNWKK